MSVLARFLILFLFLCAFVFQTPCFAVAKAQESSKKDPAKLKVWANVRFRYEAQDNFNLKSYGKHPVVGDEDDTFLLGRFRFGFKGNLYKNISYSIGVQHSEAWGLEINDSKFHKACFGCEHNPYEDDLEPFNTFLTFNDLFSTPIDIKVGRQLIYYGDKRIFGPGQWGNTGRWMWDAAKLHYPFGKNFIDLYYGATMLHDPDQLSWAQNNGFYSFGSYCHFKLPEKYMGIIIEPFAMTKDSDDNEFKDYQGNRSDLDAYYVGMRIAEQDHEGFDWDMTYILERGDFAEDDIDAYGYHLQLAYNFNSCPVKPRLGVDYSYASGDGDPTDGDMETFDGAFGARDKMYGRINLFHWKNLKDAEVNLMLKPKKNWKVTTRFHQFWLADRKDAWYLNPKAYKDPTGQSGDEVGKELDIITVWNINKDNQIQFGAGYFWPDEFAREQASDDDAAWGFVQYRWKFSHTLIK
jgi:hypothetical protein